MNTNILLVNSFKEALTANANAPRYTKTTFNNLVKVTLESPRFKKALHAIEILEGVVVEPVKVTRKSKKVKVLRRKAKNASTVQAKTSKTPVDPNAPKRGRGRPKGSKNKPKSPSQPSQDASPVVAESRPAIEFLDPSDPGNTVPDPV